MYKNADWKEIVNRKLRTALAYLICNAPSEEWFTYVEYFLNIIVDSYHPKHRGEMLLKIKTWVDRRLEQGEEVE